MNSTFLKQLKLFFIAINIALVFLMPDKAFSRNIKVGLIITEHPITIGSNSDSSLINLNSKTPVNKTRKKESYIVQNINGLIKVTHKKSNTVLGSFSGPLKLVPDKENGLVYCNKSWYRGELLILTNNDKKNITIVNNLDLEKYLLSVVPSEIPNHWHKEALKAQTVAARSYALGYLGRRKAKGYDLESSVEDQVYLGVSVEKSSTSKAVKETNGIILIDKNNNPLIALYHSSGGGYTDSIENLWDDVSPSEHIQPRPDYDDNSPHFKWYREFSTATLNSLLKDLKIGEIQNVTALSRSIANRVTWLKITGASGETLIRGEELRKFLKLPSSKFNITFDKNSIKFAGRGYGHGLGLSQWGSKALAEKGLTYDQILSHYYTGAKLVKYTEE